jgi:putative tRNA adenosine deaminase-associated protein
LSYFAAALARTQSGWSGSEVDLGEVEDLEALAELARELADDEDGTTLVLLEEDDEYVALVRVDGGPGSLDEPRVFLSDRRAVQASAVAAMLWEEPPPSQGEDEDEGTRPVAEPVGDAGLLTDLGTSAEELLDLCAEEGLLPDDILTTLCERAGCLDALESVREG